MPRRICGGGAAARSLAPVAEVEYEFKGTDTTGYSPGYDVVDPKGRKWDVKTGDEGQPEVMASRLLWAVGYHQPIVYFVPEWKMTGRPGRRGRTSGRFRLSSDHDTDGEWSWTENPFLGTRQLKGLVVANLILNNWDLKPSQNRIYTEVRGNPARWFVVQDLGASFGKTAWPVGNRNNIDDFETQKLVLGVENGRVQFDYHARHNELLERHHAGRRGVDLPAVRPHHRRAVGRSVRAARAVPQEVGVRYIAKIKSKIQEGLALQSQGATR